MECSNILKASVTNSRLLDKSASRLRTAFPRLSLTPRAKANPGPLSEIENAVLTFRSLGNNNFILLHGFQNYPTKLEETDLSLISNLKKMFNVEVGLADHLDGDDEFAKILPILALPYGATYIEKHLTIDRSAKSEDFESALDGKGFKKMVDFIRLSETAMGTPHWKSLSEATLRYRSVVRKRLVASGDINEGEVLTKDKIMSKRCDVGLFPDEDRFVLGRRAKTNLKKDDAITLESLN